MYVIWAPGVGYFVSPKTAWASSWDKNVDKAAKFNTVKEAVRDIQRLGQYTGVEIRRVVESTPVVPQWIDEGAI